MYGAMRTGSGCAGTRRQPRKTRRHGKHARMQPIRRSASNGCEPARPRPEVMQRWHSSPPLRQVKGRPWSSKGRRMAPGLPMWRILPWSDRPTQLTLRTPPNTSISSPTLRAASESATASALPRPKSNGEKRRQPSRKWVPSSTSDSPFSTPNLAHGTPRAAPLAAPPMGVRRRASGSCGGRQRRPTLSPTPWQPCGSTSKPRATASTPADSVTQPLLQQARQPHWQQSALPGNAQRGGKRQNCCGHRLGCPTRLRITIPPCIRRRTRTSTM
mmetsp:Transcript_8652/g.22366  ORF Transcript_8652/g.22366 Transcript_8652/m.22366 type:complete len:272 (-) Transcript_8652:214-1029(-)